MTGTDLRESLDEWRQGRTHGFYITAQQAGDAKPVHFGIGQMPEGIFPESVLLLPNLLMIAVGWVDSEADLWPVCRWETMNMSETEQDRWGMVLAKLLERRFGGLKILEVSASRKRPLDDVF